MKCEHWTTVVVDFSISGMNVKYDELVITELISDWRSINNLLALDCIT